MLTPIAFYALSGLTLLSALAVVLHRNTVHSSLFLGLSLAGVAGLYAMLGADFLFAAQVMVYVSGVAVLVMFVVMLLGRASDLHLRQVNEYWLAALIVCAIASVGLFKVAAGFSGMYAPGPAAPTTRAIGGLLLGEDLVPFELISLVLIAALLGAVFFARGEEAEGGR